MKQNSKKNYVITSLALYFTYFIHGIGASVLGQYKPQFAKVWGATVGSDGTVDVSMVVSVIAALGLGRLISLPFSGPISDKFGRKLSGMIGVICYGIFFFGIVFSPSMGVAYAFAIVGGIANSFLDTCVSPTCMEIYVNNPSIANLFTKFSMCISQFLLPFFIGMVAAANMSYRTIFLVAGILPTVPGASIYRSVYFLIQGQTKWYNFYLIQTIQIAGAMAVAIFIVDSLFRLLRNKTS